MAKVTGDHDISTFSNSTHESMWGLTFALCVPKFIRIHDLGLPDKRLRMRQTATDCESSTDHHVFGQRSEVRHINLSSCSPQKPGNIIWKKTILHLFPQHRLVTEYHPPRPPRGRSTASSSTGPRPSAWSAVHNVAPASSARKGWRWQRKNCGKAGWQYMAVGAYGLTIWVNLGIFFNIF